MEIDRNYGEGEVPVRGESTKPSGETYSLPVVGNAVSGARQFYGEMAPREADSTEVRVAKEVFRWPRRLLGRLLLRWSCWIRASRRGEHRPHAE